MENETIQVQLLTIVPLIKKKEQITGNNKWFKLLRQSKLPDFLSKY